MGAAAAQPADIGIGNSRGDEFYEEMEAPKFVDLTAPDHYNPDDRYWFCSRVGCDRRHEDEIDPEEIEKNFVLRVMAARSPNIKLRKALIRKPTNISKCPLSAPPKPSRPRISRLAVLSSISKKLVDGKENVKTVRPIAVTPIAKSRKPSSVSNALTTPGNKQKRVLKPELFRSVRNPKQTVAPVQSTKTIVKTLKFPSPKKALRKKASSEFETSVSKICAGMKKLEITGQKKIWGANRKLPSDAPKKKLRAREVKSRVFDSLRSQDHKGKESGPSTSMKRKAIDAKLTEHKDSAIHDASSGDSSDMEVESHRGSLEESSEAGSKLFEVPVSQACSDELTEELTVEVEKLMSSSDDDKENVSAATVTGVQAEILENAEKENVVATDNNRNRSEGAMIRKEETNGKAEKTTRKVVGMTLRGGKYTKPMPTNPRPFRLRTDERMILKEANSEKKLFAPLKETSPTVFGFSAGNHLARKHQNLLKKNGNVSLQSEDERSKPQDKPSIRNKHLSHASLRIERPTFTSERRVVSKHQRPIITSQYQSKESIRRAKTVLLKQQSPRTVSNKKGASGKSTESNEGELKLNSNAADPAIKATAPRSVSRDRRPTTIPKEPNFHRVHVPKTCAQKLAQE